MTSATAARISAPRIWVRLRLTADSSLDGD